jgi:hypothetical protein
MAYKVNASLERSGPDKRLAGTALRKRQVAIADGRLEGRLEVSSRMRLLISVYKRRWERWIEKPLQEQNGSSSVMHTRAHLLRA